MANLIKIKEVALYVGLTVDAMECFDVKSFLDASGIKFSLLHYNDSSQHSDVFGALSTWHWKDGVTRTFTKFPIVHWKNCYDDFETDVACATSLDELKTSELLANKQFVG